MIMMMMVGRSGDESRKNC